MGRVFVKAEATHAPQSLMFDRAGVPLITSNPSTPLKDSKGPLSSLGGGIGTALGTGLALTEQHRDFNSFLNSLIRQGVDFGRLGRGLGRGADNLFAEKPTPEQLRLQHNNMLRQRAMDRYYTNRLIESMRDEARKKVQSQQEAQGRVKDYERGRGGYIDSFEEFEDEDFLRALGQAGPLSPEYQEMYEKLRSKLEEQNREEKLTRQAEDRLRRNEIYAELQEALDQDKEKKKRQREAKAAELQRDLPRKIMTGDLPVQLGDSRVTTPGTAEVIRNPQTNVVAGAAAGGAGGAAVFNPNRPVEPLKYSRDASKEIARDEGDANNSNVAITQAHLKNDLNIENDDDDVPEFQSPTRLR